MFPEGNLGEGNGTPLQYSCLENPMDGGAWWAAIHGVAEGWTWLSDYAFTFHFHALEKEMATHSSVLAWRIPGTGEPGGLPSMGSHRVGYDWSNLAAVEGNLTIWWQPFFYSSNIYRVSCTVQVLKIGQERQQTSVLWNLRSREWRQDRNKTCK